MLIGGGAPIVAVVGVSVAGGWAISELAASAWEKGVLQQTWEKIDEGLHDALDGVIDWFRGY